MKISTIPLFSLPTALSIFIIGLLMPQISQSESSVSNDNEVRLLLEGYATPIEGKEVVPGVSEDGARLVASTMGIIKNKDAVVFVDPGFVKDRSLIFAALDEAKITPESVTHVFISHHHPDHTINAALFPNATVVDFGSAYKNDLWSDRGENFEIAPGIRVIRTPGHTNEDASLVVETQTGTVIFTHVWWNEMLFPEIDPLGEDQNALEASRQIVFDTADCIIPGHGKPFPNPQKPEASCSMVTGID